MTHFWDLYARDTKDSEVLGEKVVANIYFTFFHELGHALRDNLQLPVTGREEDAVDQLATLLLLQMGDEGVVAALDAADAFAMEADEDSREPMPLWDDHSMSGQGMFDTLCLLYGSNPKAFELLASKDAIPAERAERCQEDFELVAKAWRKLLAPHVIGDKPLDVRLPPSGDVANAVAVLSQEDSKAKAAKPGAKGGPNCLAVADHAVNLLEADLKKEFGDDMDEFKVEADLFYNGVVGSCQDDNWLVEDRKCVIDAKSASALEACFE